MIATKQFNNKMEFQEPQYISSTTFFENVLDISFNKKMTWSREEKKAIQDMLYEAYYKGGEFYWKMNNDYNIVHVVKEIHVTEAGRHFNIVLCHNPSIITKPRQPEADVTTTLHCRVCFDAHGLSYISKFSQVVEWL